MASKGKVSPSPKEKKLISSSSSQARKTNVSNQPPRKSPSTSKHTSPIKRRQDSSSTSPSENRPIPNYLKPTICSGGLDPSISSSPPPPPSDHNKLRRHNTITTTSSSSSNIGKPNFNRRRSFDRPLLPTTPSSQSQKTRTAPTPKERSSLRSSSFTTRSTVPHPDTRLPLKSPNKGSSANSLQGKMGKKSEEIGGATKEQDIIITSSNDINDTSDEILSLDHQLQDDHPNSSLSTNITDHQQVLDDVHDRDLNSTVIITSRAEVDVDDDRRDVINVVVQKQEEKEEEEEVEVAGNHDVVVVDEEVEVAQSSPMEGDNQEPAINYDQIENPQDHDATTLNTQAITETVNEVVLEEAEPKEENIAAAAGEVEQEQEPEQELVDKGREKKEAEEGAIEHAAEMEHVAVENEDDMKEQQQQQQKQEEINQGKRKESNSVSNDVIEETAMKLREQRKNKVKALAGAFETVISLQEPK